METNKPDRRVFRLISTLILITLIVILALQNSDGQMVKVYFWDFSLPLFVLLFFCFLIGIALMLVLLYPKYRRVDKAERKVFALREQISDLERQLVQAKAEKEKAERKTTDE